VERLRVTYHVDSAEPEARADEIAIEQTVEVPRSALRDAFLEREVLGHVERVEADPAGGYRATIDYAVATTGLDPAQLLNVIFGNASLQEDVRCVDVDVPATLRAALEGPRFGIEGLRKALDVWDRLAELCRTFARAGIDVIKDDHGLASQPWSIFEERVVACLDAARRAADETGRQALYVPNLIGTPERVLAALRHAEQCGARAVMISPMLVGLPFFWELVHRHASVPVLAHPAFGGALRIAPEALFGRLFRLFGADAVIFVNFGSRFRRSREDCRCLADRLIGSWGGVAPALPVPGGGIRLENAAELAAFYGRDAMLLVGGDLQVVPEAIFERSRRFAEIVERAATGPGARAL
jgi:ribulose-bisphosphate carboxylase large chain